MNLLSLVNLSLEVVYYSTTLSNHCIIRFIRFISRFHPGVIEWIFVSYPYLILLIIGQMFEVTVAQEILRTKQGLNKNFMKSFIALNFMPHQRE